MILDLLSGHHFCYVQTVLCTLEVTVVNGIEVCQDAPFSHPKPTCHMSFFIPDRARVVRNSPAANMLYDAFSFQRLNNSTTYISRQQWHYFLSIQQTLFAVPRYLSSTCSADVIWWHLNVNNLQPIALLLSRHRVFPNQIFDRED